MKAKNGLLISLLFMFVTALYINISSCGNSAKSDPDPQAWRGPYVQNLETQKVLAYTPVLPIDYGNGVYYFPATEREFGISLFVFLADTTKELVSIAGDGTGGTNDGGWDKGYWVVVKER